MDSMIDIIARLKLYLDFFNLRSNLYLWDCLRESRIGLTYLTCSNLRIRFQSWCDTRETCFTHSAPPLMAILTLCFFISEGRAVRTTAKGIPSPSAEWY